MFSLHNGRTTIEREGDGSVAIFLRDLPAGDPNGGGKVTFTPDEWVSVVTSVAEKADSAEAHDLASRLHGIKAEPGLCETCRFETTCPFVREYHDGDARKAAAYLINCDAYGPR